MNCFNGNRLKIAIQKKGRLNEPAVGLLKSVGFDFDGAESRKEQLFARCRNFDLDILFLRDDDIPEYVQDGVCDLGVVGLNVYGEKRCGAEILEKLGFGKCQLSLAVPAESPAGSAADLSGCRIATSYPVLLRRFLDSRGIDAGIIELSGSVEIAPALQVADAICDLVSTGNTLRMNGLRAIETVLESEGALIRSPIGFLPDKAALLDKLLLRIRGRLMADQTKYIMLNAPREALPAIQAIIPGLSSPTVVPLADSGMIAIHSVVPENVFWDVIEKLKRAGATGILVLPIEKMIL